MVFVFECFRVLFIQWLSYFVKAWLSIGVMVLNSFDHSGYSLIRNSVVKNTLASRKVWIFSLSLF